MKRSPQSQALADLATRNAWRFEDRYSGRMMFGARCPGIVCPPRDSGRVRSAARKAGITTEARQDSMGRDIIVYWPLIRDGETR